MSNSPNDGLKCSAAIVLPLTFPTMLNACFLWPCRSTLLPNSLGHLPLPVEHAHAAHWVRHRQVHKERHSDQLPANAGTEIDVVCRLGAICHLYDCVRVVSVFRHLQNFKTTKNIQKTRKEIHLVVPLALYHAIVALWNMEVTSSETPHTRFAACVSKKQIKAMRLLCSCYYTVVVGWCLYYMFLSMVKELPGNYQESEDNFYDMAVSVNVVTTSLWRCSVVISQLPQASGQINECKLLT